MDIVIWLVLTFIAIILTFLMIALEDYKSIYGFGLVLSIICLVGWIIAGLSAIDISETTLVFNGTSGVIETQVIYHNNSWIITLFYLMLSIFPLLMILKKIPETWKMKEEE